MYQMIPFHILHGNYKNYTGLEHLGKDNTPARHRAQALLAECSPDS